VTSRAEFFDRIRAEMGRTRDLAPVAPSVRPARPRERLHVLRRELSERWRENLHRFQHEFERVGGVFHRVADVREAPEAVARIASGDITAEAYVAHSLMSRHRTSTRWG